MDGVVPSLVVASGLIIATFTDIRQFKVYNALTFPIFFGGLIWGFANDGWSGLGFALAGAVTGLLILLIPYLMGGLGAGDVKFVAAIGSWIGAAYLLPAILIGCLVLFVYYMVITARRQGFSMFAQNLQLMFAQLSCFGRNLAGNDQFESVQSAARDLNSPNRSRLIPFSAMMSIGILIVLIIGKWTQSH